jgi:hypothetical protein
MNIEVGQTYKTPSGLFLKVKKVGEVSVHTFWLVDKEGEIVPEQRNSRGHVITRNIRICTEDTIRTFKKIKNGENTHSKNKRKVACKQQTVS